MSTVAQSKHNPASSLWGPSSQSGPPDFQLICLDARLQVASATDGAFKLLGFELPNGASLKKSTVPPQVIRLCEMAIKDEQESRLLIHVTPGTGAELELVAIPLTRGGSPVKLALLIREAALSGYVSQNIRRLDRLANIGLFSASMAHEIRNALVAVRTFADLLLEKESDNEMAGVMQHETTRIENIVNRMLRFAGPLRQAPTRFDAHEVLDHALRMLSRQIENQSHALERNYQAGNAVVEGDQLQLEQAFVNLFLNAIEAMESRGTLKVSTSVIPLDPSAQNQPAAPHLQVLVEDTGPGILAEDQPRLFEPFFTTKEHGTGLGLAIARTIIIEHNGSITVQSDPGCGTQFCVRLPLV